RRHRVQERRLRARATTSWCSTRCSAPWPTPTRCWSSWAGHLRAGGQVLEARHQRGRGGEDPEEPPVVRAPGPDRGGHPGAAERRVRRRPQLRARLRVLPARGPHLPGVRDAGAEPLRLPQAEQVQPAAPALHPARAAAGGRRPAQAQGPGPHPRRPQAREHHAGGPAAPALPRQGHRLRLGQPRLQGRLLHLPAVAVLQVSSLPPPVFASLCFSGRRRICRRGSSPLSCPLCSCLPLLTFK
ncbi:hypothetical protein ANANG_G00316420, partial [Anguilla anguilla]